MGASIGRRTGKAILWLALAMAFGGCLDDEGDEPIDPIGKPPGGGGTPTYVPMHLEFENYFFNGVPDRGCIGEDRALVWSAAGSLAPGESFTFVRQVPSCAVRAITAVATWDRSELELTEHVPAHEYVGYGKTNLQPARDVVAPNVGRSAQACAFIYVPVAAQSSVSYTIKNVGSETAYAVKLTGGDHNDWEMYYRGQCVNADYDRDGFSDYYEHATAELVSPHQHGSDNPDYEAQVSVCFYEQATGTATPGDEVDFYPPDFDDDNAVTEADRTRLQAYLGQGTGFPLGRIDANGGPEGPHAQDGLWRRFDLTADGMVDQEDEARLEALMGTPIPAAVDDLAPKVVFMDPPDGFAISGDKLYALDAEPFDERSIARLEYLVDGAVVCNKTVADSHVWDPHGYVSEVDPWVCSWRSPRGNGARTFLVQARVTDGAGNVALSEIIRLQR